MTSISNLFNHFMSLVGLNHYNKSESDNKYATKTHNHSEYLTSHQDITGKVDKAQGSSNKNKNVVTDSNGTITTEAKPVIPTKTSDLTNDSNYVTTSDSRLTDARTPKTHTHGNISNDGKIGSDTGKIITTGSNGVLTASSSITKSLISDFPTSMTPTSHSHGSLANGGTLNSDISSVNKIAVTDSSNNLKTISQLPYSKISGTPTIPTKTSDLTNNSGFLTSHNPVDDSLSSTSTNALQNKVINTALNGKENISNKSSNITTDTGSTTKYPTVQAVENYVNSKVDASFKVEVIQNYSVQDLEDDYAGNDGNAFGMYIDDAGLNYDANTIYLLYNDDLVYGRGSYYNEYILINDTGQYPVFELLGTTQMDLSGLLTKSEADTFYQPLGNYLTSLPSHNHNDLYYTESEVNSLLNSKLNTSDFATQLEAVIDSLITEAQS